MNRFRSLARCGATFGAVCLLLWFQAALSLHAQNSQGTVLGHVTDPSGAAVVGATVRITSAATAVTRTVKTSSVGDYVFVNIPPGNYDIVVGAL